MAASATASFLKVPAALAVALALPLAGAPLNLRLEEASARSGADFVPAYAGKTVAVKGLVSCPPISFLPYQHLAIQEGHSGLILEGPSGLFDKLNPGDQIE